MGNQLGCSCAPLSKKYNYDDNMLQTQQRRDGHLLRLWAEVYHVSAASGAIRWQQITSDLVPVNITCIQDTPECVFQITAYNSQVEKILDVRLTQPGTRLGQASVYFVYWKDTATGDTWGLNFAHADDAKRFRMLCSRSFGKISRKATSSYSLRLSDNTKNGNKNKRKPLSTPSSPRRYNELQCTCMAADTLHKQRNGRVRYTGSSTMPKSAFRETSSGNSMPMTMKRAQQEKGRVQYSRAQYAQSVRKEHTRSMDSTLYPKGSVDTDSNVIGSSGPGSSLRTEKKVNYCGDKSRSKSSDDVRRTVATATDDLILDSGTLKKMLHPIESNGLKAPSLIDRKDKRREFRDSRSDVSRRRSLERTHCVDYTDISPPSDGYSESKCFATPSSSGDEGVPTVRKLLQKVDQATKKGENGSSPTIKALQDYEAHLRNALAVGAESDTFSLNTFEHILSQSIENVVTLIKEVQSELDAIRREEYGRWARSNTLPARGAFRRGTSLPPFLGSSVSELCGRQTSVPILDTLSIDGLPINTGIGLTHQTSFESTDSRVYLTSSEVRFLLMQTLSFYH